MSGIICGVSTASLFPMNTEDALLRLAESGVSHLEIFFNSMSEIQGPIFDQIRSTQNKYGLDIVSVHPFSSAMESTFLFSNYERRVCDMIDMYKQYFEIMNILGADIFVIHGAIKSSHCPDESYFTNFNRLAEIGNSYGIRVAQENVSYCKSGSLDFLKRMKEHLGKNARFVLDLKQAVRSSLSPFDIVEALGNSIIHCHVSDSSNIGDCLPIGQGTFDFTRLAAALERNAYKGAFIVELYRENYREYHELKASEEKLKSILQNAQ